MGSISDQGTKIAHASGHLLSPCSLQLEKALSNTQHSQKKKKKDPKRLAHGELPELLSELGVELGLEFMSLGFF